MDLEESVQTWTQFIRHKLQTSERLFGNGNEHSSSINGGKFLDLMSNH
jgi:hypothetical protein